MKVSRPALRSITLAALAIAPLACSSEAPPPPALATRQQLLDPESCRSCHEGHVREWSGSMHAYAADDPVFRAMNRRGQRETGGALGDFCVRCHAPLALQAGLTKDGLNLDTLPRAYKGVTCFFCHTVDAVEGTHNNPLRLSNSLEMRGPIADPVGNGVHASVRSELHDRDRTASASMCGACHDIVTGHGAHIERTFAEWKGSVFAKPGGATCSQCHMEQSATLRAVAPGGPPRRTHSHTFAAVDLALDPFPEREAQRAEVEKLLQATLQTALCVGDDRRVRVVVDNVGAGHGFPSGSSSDRRIWFEVRAFDASGTIYESGLVPDGASPVTSSDPDLWLLRDCLFDPKGTKVSMLWEAASHETNQLPAPATFDLKDPTYRPKHFVQTFPRSGGLKAAPTRVTLRVRMQPVGLDVLDDLIASGDLDPKVRDAMATLEVAPLLEWTPEAATKTGVDGRPAQCVTNTRLDFEAATVAAPARARCGP